MFNEKLKIEIGQLREENERLKKELSVRRSVVDLFEESIPKDQSDRKDYMSKIAVFYGTVFKSKLAHMIYQQKDTLSKLGLTKQEEDIFRSNINCLHLIDEWCEQRTNEYLGDIRQMQEGVDDDNIFISNLKSKYIKNEN